MAEYVEVPDNNLYQTGRIIVETDGAETLERIPVSIQPTEKDRWHFVRATDELDALAWRYYGEIVDDASKYWWLIADANNIGNPADISNLTGFFLLIPDFFRAKFLAAQIAAGNYTEIDTEVNNQFSVLDNPPGSGDPSDPTGGQTDNGQSPSLRWLFLKRPNEGYVLVSADADGAVDAANRLPSDYLHPIIFTDTNPLFLKLANNTYLRIKADEDGAVDATIDNPLSYPNPVIHQTGLELVFKMPDGRYLLAVADSEEAISVSIININSYPNAIVYQYK